MKKIFGFLVRFAVCSLFSILASFCVLTLYYRDRFPVNTWINGIYCTGKTADEVNRELTSRSGEPALMILGADGASEEIASDAVDIRADYTRELRAYLYPEAGFWTGSVQSASFAEISAGRYQWDEEKLEEAFYALELAREENAGEAGVRIRYSEEAGYYLEDGNTASLDLQKAYSYLKTCLLRGETLIDLKAGDCYRDREDSARDREQRELFARIKDFAENGIVYDMGAEKIPLTYGVMCGFLQKEAGEDASLNEVVRSEADTEFAGGEPLPDEGFTREVRPAVDGQGRLVVSEEAVRDWVEQLASRYNTCGTERDFLSSRGDTVRVKYGTYGTELDVEAEVSYLCEALRTARGGTEDHVPAYKRQGYVRGLDDIGDTYIEVDMGKQHLYFYVDGKLTLDGDIVTGNMAKRWGTPEGIYYVYYKARDIVLRGADYASPVKYWMAAVRGIGLHDASWRRSFGADIYKTDGSHGCINMPLDVVSKMYEMTEIGVPVIMFY